MIIPKKITEWTIFFFGRSSIINDRPSLTAWLVLSFFFLSLSLCLFVSLPFSSFRPMEIDKLPSMAQPAIDSTAKRHCPMQYPSEEDGKTFFKNF